MEKSKTFLEKLKAFLVKNWFTIVNYIIIFIVYSMIYGREDLVWAEFLLGIWLFISAAWGGYKWFIKK